MMFLKRYRFLTRFDTFKFLDLYNLIHQIKCSNYVSKFRMFGPTSLCIPCYSNLHYKCRGRTQLLVLLDVDYRSLLHENGHYQSHQRSLHALRVLKPNFCMKLYLVLVDLCNSINREYNNANGLMLNILIKNMNIINIVKVFLI